MSSDDLLAALQRLHAERRAEIRARYNRGVPFADAIGDRWERASFLGFGEGSSVYDSALILGDVRVGKNTWVGPSTVLDGSGGLTIGDSCSISAGAQIYTHDSVRWAVSGGTAPYEYAPVEIGSNTYIGPLSVVTRGVRIGRHCVVGAHSIVNKDLPDFSIAYGSTCRIVGRVVLEEDGTVRFEYDASRRHAMPDDLTGTETPGPFNE